VLGEIEEISKFQGSPMARIAIIFPQKFEESEYRKPAEAFRKAGHELVHVGGEAKKREKRKIRGNLRRIDKSVKEVSVHDFDALLIPGGYFPDRLEFAEDEFEFVRAFMESGKFVFGAGRK
jgi:protease I